MITEKNAINLVRSKLSNYRVRMDRETLRFYLFMCEAPDPDIIPSKIAIAVNKQSGKMGSSIASYEDAIRQAT